MRMAFGIAAFLVCIGVIVWIMSAIWLPSAKQSLDVKKRVEPQVQQMAGRDAATGRPVSESIKLAADKSGGRTNGFIVTSIVEDGALAKFYGLKRGDSIVEIGPQTAKEIDQVDAAKDFLTDAFQRQSEIVVIRDGTKLTLPAKPAAGAPKPAPAQQSVEQQLQGITAPR
jgi:C-terminal processing protease CtpA/Prc